MEKVYAVIIEDTFDFGLNDIRIKVFKDKDKAKDYMNKELEDYLNAEDITRDDLVISDEDIGDYVLEEEEGYIRVYMAGNYSENHIEISIVETEIL